MEKVYQAEACRPGVLGSFGDASYMLLSQLQFPDTYDESLDQRISRDHDRILSDDYKHGCDCFDRHTGGGELGLESWFQKATPNKVLEFVKDILRADPTVSWTGYRIMGTVNPDNGHTIWTIELFAKHPNSNTKVYDTKNAPNLIEGSRHTRH